MSSFMCSASLDNIHTGKYQTLQSLAYIKMSMLLTVGPPCMHCVIYIVYTLYRAATFKSLNIRWRPPHSVVSVQPRHIGATNNTTSGWTHSSDFTAESTTSTADGVLWKLVHVLLCRLQDIWNEKRNKIYHSGSWKAEMRSTLLHVCPTFMYGVSHRIYLAKFNHPTIGITHVAIISIRSEVTLNLGWHSHTSWAISMPVDFFIACPDHSE